jgi:hypothetical protein
MSWNKSPAVATTVTVFGGTLEMDGHRPIDLVQIGMDGIQRPTCQLRATDSEGNVVELAMSKDDVENAIAVLELYR